MAKRGIDISAHQGYINLEALQPQIDFVIIRVGYGTKGTLDTKFKRNAELCKDLNIPVGFYWYSYALDVEGAKKEAKAMLKAIAPYKSIIKYGVWIDMESDKYKVKNGMPSPATLQAICAEFCKTTEEAGYYSGIYASESWLKHQLKSSSLDRYDKWTAQWPTSGGKQRGLAVEADSRSGLSLWQFTSKGRFAGYSGNLDTNYAYKTFPNPSVVPAPTPPPAPTPLPTPPVPTPTFPIGAAVVVNGDLYKSSNAASPAGRVHNKPTNITRYVAGAAHPYNTTGDLGWMNACDITFATPTPAPVPVSRLIIKGCKVRFIGDKSYSGIPLAHWTKNYIFDVLEVSGDRVVIGKGTAVTAAVKMRDCVRM